MVTVEGDGAIVRRERSIEPPGQPENFGPHVMSLGIIGRGGDGPRGCFVGTSQHLGRLGFPTVAVDEGEGLSEPHACLTIIGIDSKSILEQRDGLCTPSLFGPAFKTDQPRMVRSTASGSARGGRRPSTLTSSTLSIRASRFAMAKLSWRAGVLWST